ncbi:MAG: threonine synthase [Proteobacteria bacterium]|nr:threonine synthase [Pseudomonadota bacterium]
MNYVSTRGAGPASLDEALRKGIASDGGLFLPDKLPSFDISDFDTGESIPEVAAILLRPFFAGSELLGDIDQILAETFKFPILTKALPVAGHDLSMLQLYHGPTAAFKDVGAGFLAACLSRLEGDTGSPLTILVATSGDTGAAVAAAFDQRPGMRVAVLFPDGRVSERQEQQLCCWSDNVLSMKVRGSFDDCQSLVKAAMADQDLTTIHRFSSANSINIGRLLPQSTYYAHSSLRHYRRTGNKPGFIIPTGNLGNALACIMTREMGLPVGPIVLATNANKTIAEYFETLKWLPRDSVQTLASAMDVGDPSNMERLRKLIGEADTLRGRLVVASVSDKEIETAIRQDFEAFGVATCPHTATATHTWRQLDADVARAHDWIIVATAHPAKFEMIVEPLIGQSVPVPAELAAILSRPATAVAIEPHLEALAAALGNN